MIAAHCAAKPAFSSLQLTFAATVVCLHVARNLHRLDLHRARIESWGARPRVRKPGRQRTNTHKHTHTVTRLAERESRHPRIPSADPKLPDHRNDFCALKLRLQSSSMALLQEQHCAQKARYAHNSRTAHGFIHTQKHKTARPGVTLRRCAARIPGCYRQQRRIESRQSSPLAAPKSFDTRDTSHLTGQNQGFGACQQSREGSANRKAEYNKRQRPCTVISTEAIRL
jgi:hypothetical protein